MRFASRMRKKMMMNTTAKMTLVKSTPRKTEVKPTDWNHR